MMGGILTSFLSELMVYPAIYYLIKRRSAATGNGIHADSAATSDPLDPRLRDATTVEGA